MKRFFEDTNTLFASIIGIVGGFIWAINNNWDFEPIILICISSIGLICFIGVKVYDEKVRPIIEMELKHITSSRGPLIIAPGISPQNDEGDYIQDDDGIYHYEFEHSYELIVRNNSIHNAYNVNLYVEKKYFLKFQNETSSLEPLTIDKPKIIKVKSIFGKNLKYRESMEELSIKFNEELKNTLFIVEYHDENRKTYFTQFNAPKNNKILTKKPKIDITKLRLI